MLDSIHDLIEDLAQRVRRNVAVDDAGLRLIAYSSHFADADPARLRQLVDKLVDPSLQEFLRASRMHSWQGLQRVPAVPELGLTLDRIAFPLRSRYELLGLMWVIDEPALSEQEIAGARATADEIQRLLARRLQDRQSTDLATERQLARLLGPNADGERESAVAALHELGLFANARSFMSLSAAFPDAASAEFGESSADIVNRSLGLATASRLRSSFAALTSASECTVVLSGRAPLTLADSQALATELLREIRKIDPRLAEGVTIGIGSVVDELSDAVVSLEQARVALRVAAARGQSVIAWEQHPLDVYLAATTVAALPEHLVPRSLREAVAAQSPEALGVIAAYLDNACNVIATAEQLRVHRTTVYYRIQRFEELSGLSLSSGTDRLLLHAWLRTRPYTA